MYYYLASTYGSGNYDSANYNGTNVTTTTGGTSDGTQAAGGILTNTGFDIVLAASVAAALIFAALIIRIWRRKPQTANEAQN